MFLTRVRIENFRSIAACDVRLGPLTVLAGPNAAGKSNFLDALRFVRDALRTSPGQALEPRGGLEEILHRSPAGTRSDSFRIRLDVTVPAPEQGSEPGRERGVLDASYLMEVGADPDPGADGRPGVRWEELRLPDLPDRPALFALPESERHVRSDGWRDDLLLSKVSRTNREVYAVARSLHSMRFYELHTPVLRDIDQTRSKRGDAVLGERGESLARVLSSLARHRPWVKDTVDGYISTMIENAAGLDGKEFEEADLAYVVGRFVEDGSEDGSHRQVDRRSLSDGTLRLAGVLAALFQSRVLNGSIPFVGIEEPEISLHPPMLGALYDALVGASDNTQVMVTTQSADLLDSSAADPGHLLVVRDDGHGSTIGPIDETGRSLLADGVLTLPELLRSGEMRPESGVPHNLLEGGPE
ncbi:AAA family ATPase [Streptomyces sp. SID12501]|uniref:AAA family ATPase n=1 Tax=Streptomyces sp. SID12501 TaxID=2706042 RepID=A0A6B3BQ79_9ACTN|nr:AAA family ATPase [Streptomyces sp. SID12501]NEC86472.1 AAA family ATPase [Streptomyces sp. SID12501]